MNGRLLLVIGFIINLTACSTPEQIQLMPGANLVKVAKSDPSDNFAEVGQITGIDGHGCGAFGSRGGYEGAIVDLKNKAYLLGGEYVQIFTISEPHLAGGCFVNQYAISGAAYKKVRELPSPTPILSTARHENSMANDQGNGLQERFRILEAMHNNGLISDEQFKAESLKLLK